MIELRFATVAILADLCRRLLAAPPKCLLLGDAPAIRELREQLENAKE